MMKLRGLLDYAQRGWEHYSRLPLALRPIRRGPRHGLDAPLVLSLTSHPPRFPTLHLTLRALLNQSVSPDRLMLWLDHDAVAKLPRAVRALERYGLEVRGCEDVGALTKFLPAYEQFPDSYIAIADDDIYYRRDWLSDLVAAALPGTRDVVAFVVRRYVTDGDGLRPIAEWDMNACDSAAHDASADLFAVGVNGVLYPPRSVHPDLSDRALFQRLSPTCDDSWIAWMVARAGTKVRRVPVPARALIGWKGTNRTSLSKDNFATGHDHMKQDVMLSALTDQYGALHCLKR